MDGKKLIPSLKIPFDAILTANKTKDWLPTSEGIITALEKIVKVFEDTIQIQLIKERWEEIQKYQVEIE
jgi:hypothetical protein